MRDERDRKWVLALCAIPLSVAAMLCTIWFLHHGYLSIHRVHHGLLSNSNRRLENRIIIFGLLAPFLVVLFAITAFFMRDNNQQ